MGSPCHVVLWVYFSIACFAPRKHKHTWLYFCGLWPVSFYPLFHNWSMLNCWPVGTSCYQTRSWSLLQSPACCRSPGGVSSHGSCKGLESGALFRNRIPIPQLEPCFLYMDFYYLLESHFYETNYIIWLVLIDCRLLIGLSVVDWILLSFTSLVCMWENDLIANWLGEWLMSRKCL